MKVVLGWNINFSHSWSLRSRSAHTSRWGGCVRPSSTRYLQFILIWAGALLVPILGLIADWRLEWPESQDHRTTSIHRPAHRPGQTMFIIWRSIRVISPTNPMGVHWTGIVFGLGFVISFGYWTTDFLVVQRVSGSPHICVPRAWRRLLGRSSRWRCRSS
jgi:SSS family solute:Na+ symporter